MITQRNCRSPAKVSLTKVGQTTTITVTVNKEVYLLERERMDLEELKFQIENRIFSLKQRLFLREMKKFAYSAYLSMGTKIFSEYITNKIRSFSKIQGILYLRKHFGFPLRVSKNIVDELHKDHQSWGCFLNT